ncbi:MAG TPA: hypothetical protein VGC71_13920 [Gaiellales bacterium]|jgi:hypothetical protein
MRRGRLIFRTLILVVVLSLTQAPFAPSAGWSFAYLCVAGAGAIAVWYAARTGRLR